MTYYTLSQVSTKFGLSPQTVSRLWKYGHIRAGQLSSNREGYRVTDTEDFRRQIVNVKRFIKLKGNVEFYDPCIDYNVLAENGIYSRKHIAYLTSYDTRTIAALEKLNLLMPEIKIAKSRYLYLKTPAIAEIIDLLRTVKKANGSARAVLLARRSLQEQAH